MAIRTQQFKIPLVGVPVFEAAAHDIVSVGGTVFQGGIDVMNIEHPVVIIPAGPTCPSKLSDNLSFPLPLPALLCLFVIGMIVVGPLAVWRAIAGGTSLSALAAFTVMGPAMGEVACLTAILPSAVSDAIRMHWHRLSAVRTLDGNRLGSHDLSISQYIGARHSRYFDIACKRIEEAYRQPRLFDDKGIDPSTQLTMFDGLDHD